MERYISYIVDGLSLGSLYGLLALALVFIHRSTRLVNMAQGELAMITTYLALVYLRHLPAWAAITLALISAFAVGALLDLGLFRRVGEGRDLNAIIVSVGLFTVVNSLAVWTFGSIPEPFPSPFGDGASRLGGIVISHQSLGTLGASSVVIAIVAMVFRFTRLGLAMRGTAQNWLAARLVGVPVKAMFTVGWGLACMLGCVAGLLAAPKLFLSPAMMQPILVYAIAAAVVGGLDSPVGAVVGGLLVGVIESLAGSWEPIGSELKTVATVALLVCILILRPTGLFGKPKLRKV